MGEEYRIKFRYESAEQADEILREAPHFSQYLPQYQQYEYRLVPSINLDKLPDVSTGLLPDGFYFCIQGGNRRVPASILAYLEEVATKTGQTFVVEDLE